MIASTHAAVWLLELAVTAGMFWVAPSGNRRHPGPSWFDLQPHMTQSKKQRGRAQQTAAHRRRRTRR